MSEKLSFILLFAWSLVSLSTFSFLKNHLCKAFIRISPFPTQWNNFRLSLHILEEGMAAHASILAWRIPWTEEPGGLLSIGSHRVGHNWSDLAGMHALEKEMTTHFCILAWRIPGTEEPGGLLSTGSHRVGHDWSDLAAAAANKLYFKKNWSVLQS